MGRRLQYISFSLSYRDVCFGRIPHVAIRLRLAADQISNRTPRDPMASREGTGFQFQIPLPRFSLGPRPEDCCNSREKTYQASLPSNHLLIQMSKSSSP